MVALHATHRRLVVQGALCLLLVACTPQGAHASTVDDLLARTQSCKQVSNGKFRMDDGESGTVPICALDGAYFFKADMDIDCDGERTAACNEDTDPWFQPQTSFVGSDGRYPRADEVPWVVLPTNSSVFDFRARGVKPGALTLALYNGQLSYGAFIDENAEGSIGEASYAMAQELGIDPDPQIGGVSGTSVTYLVFTGDRAVVTPLESTTAARELGRELVAEFLGAGGSATTLTAAATRIAAPGSVTVSWSTNVSLNKGWIGLYRADASDRQFTNYQYVSGASGSKSFRISSAGTYDFRMFNNDRYDRLAQSTSVTATDGGDGGGGEDGGGDCSIYTGSPLESERYIAPYDVAFGTGRVLVRTYCEERGFEVSVTPPTTGEGIFAVRKDGYYWDGARWIRYTYQGTTPSGWGSYRSGVAHSPLIPYVGAEGRTYVATYTCSLVEDVWRCGCSDEACTESERWNLQAAAHP